MSQAVGWWNTRDGSVSTPMPGPYGVNLNGTMGVVDLVVYNKTGHDLEVEDTYTDGGLIYGSDPKLITPPAELGADYCSVGFWRWGDLNQGITFPGGVVKFKASPATKGLPTYVGVDMYRPFIAMVRYSVSAGCADHGSAKDYYDKFVNGGDKGKHSNTSKNKVVNISGRFQSMALRSWPNIWWCSATIG